MSRRCDRQPCPGGLSVSIPSCAFGPVPPRPQPAHGAGAPCAWQICSDTWFDRERRSTMKNLLSALALSTALVAGAAFADEVKPAVVFDMGGKFDRSFNEGIYNGSKKW